MSERKKDKKRIARSSRRRFKPSVVGLSLLLLFFLCPYCHADSQHNNNVRSIVPAVKKSRHPHHYLKATSTSVSAKKTTFSGIPINFLIRSLFLCYYGSLGSLMPYLPVYYDSLGHGGQIIGLLGAVKPATTFMVAPVWGLLADQLQNPFLILQLTFLVSLVGQLLLACRDDARFIMAMVFVTALFNAPVKSLLDSMVLDHIPDKTQYGRLRLWGQMGFGLGSSLVGVLLSKSKQIHFRDTTTHPELEVWLDDQFSSSYVRQAIRFLDKFWQSLTGYKLLFFTYAALSLPTWMCIQAFRRLDLQQKQTEEEEETAAAKIREQKKPKTPQKTETAPTPNATMQGLNLLFHNADVLFFFFLVLVVGISSGVIENFAYVRLREVGGTGKEMGLSRLVSSVAGAPMFWFSGTCSNIGLARMYYYYYGIIICLS